MLKKMAKCGYINYSFGKHRQGVLLILTSLSPGATSHRATRSIRANASDATGRAATATTARRGATAARGGTTTTRAAATASRRAEDVVETSI